MVAIVDFVDKFWIIVVSVTWTWLIKQRGDVLFFLLSKNKVLNAK